MIFKHNNDPAKTQEMRKKILGAVLLVLVSILPTYAQNNELPAFPGAEGGGKFTSGGRGGKVIYVTNLADNSSAGSLRFAVNQPGARIVVFAVSGTIQLKSNLNIKNANITIAGQTAPGDGICLRDYPVVVEADNVIIRFMRFRMGDEAKQQNDCIWGRDQKNIIIDHCSMSWSTDECASFYDNENFTMQWCLLSESLRNSVHGKGAHGYGGIWGGKNASFHHNLLADHDSRNPRFCGSRYSNKPDLELVDFRNNVIYNWGSNSSYGAEGGSYNIVNNYFKAGPATSSSSKSRILQPYADDGANIQPAGTYGKFHITGNYVASSPAVSNDNWQGISLHSTFTSYAAGITKNNTKSETEFSAPIVTTQTAQKAFEKVLNYVGSSQVRDTVDKRIIHDTSTGTATFMTGGNGSVNGIIDSQSAVGGWPELKSLQAPTDSDNDGMPDYWEDKNGLHKNNPSDAQLSSVDGKYPNVEAYINSLVASITENQNNDSVITAVAEIPAANNPLKVYLDNSTGILKISHIKAISLLKVYSMTGALLKMQKCDDNQEEMQVSDLYPGIYIVSVQENNQVLYSTKIVKN